MIWYELTCYARGKSDITPGNFERIDYGKQLVESRRERLTRLNKDWVLNEYTKTQFEEESEAKDQKQEQLAHEISKNIEAMRRLKIKIDLKSVAQAKRQIFGEHVNLDLGKESIQFEKLKEYLELPENLKVRSKTEILENKSINNMVTRWDNYFNKISIFENRVAKMALKSVKRSLLTNFVGKPKQ